MSDHKFRLLPQPPRDSFFSWLLRISSLGLAIFCYQAYRHHFPVNPHKPFGHLLTQILFLAAPILWAFALVRMPQSVVEGETTLCQNSPAELAARNWWNILLYVTPALTGFTLLAEQASQNSAALTLAYFTLPDALMTAAALFAAALAAACVRLTGGTLSRLNDGLRLGLHLFLPWDQIGTVVKFGEYYGFCAPRIDGVTGGYLRIRDAEVRQWLDGALTEIGARFLNRPAPLDLALQFVALPISIGTVFLGRWLHSNHIASWQWVLLLCAAIAFASIACLETLRGFARVERLKPASRRAPPAG